MLLNPKKIKNEAEKNWEKEWKETAELVKGKGKFTLKKKTGSEHLLWKYILKVREVFLEMGFDEIILNPIQPDDEVRKQYGPESGAILDRLYYLATIPRPDIGLSDEKKNLLKRGCQNSKNSKNFRIF